MNFVDELKAEAATAAQTAASEDERAPNHEGDAPQSDTDQRYATGDSDGAPPSTESTSDAPTVPRRALEDEREKRQLERQLREGLERRLKELESRIASTQTQTQQQSDDAIPYDRIFEDPEAVFKTYSQAIEKKLGSRSMEMSREIARAQFSDYDETIEKLQTLQVPGLEEAIAKSASPAHTAYSMIKRHEREMQARSNPPEMDALKRQLEEAQRELASIRGEVQRPPVSLSQARGASAGTTQAVKTVDSVLANAWDNKVLRGR